MNIFMLDTIPERAPRHLVDAHVVKMPLETAQIMCTAAYLRGVDPSVIPYKPTHQNHPCVVWANACPANLLWLDHYLHGGLAEFKLRFGHTYDGLLKIQNRLLMMSAYARDSMIRLGASATSTEITNPYLAMPEWFKVEPEYSVNPFMDYVQSYKNYYYNEKRNISMGKKNPYSRSPRGAAAFVSRYEEDSLNVVRLERPGEKDRMLKLHGYRKGHRLGVDIPSIHVSSVEGKTEVLWKDMNGIILDSATL